MASSAAACDESPGWSEAPLMAGGHTQSRGGAAVRKAASVDATLSADGGRCYAMIWAPTEETCLQLLLIRLIGMTCRERA